MRTRLAAALAALSIGLIGSFAATPASAVEVGGAGDVSAPGPAVTESDWCDRFPWWPSCWE